jgi:hypothetical protein
MYVTARLLHKDLNVTFVSDLTSSRYKSFHSSILNHENPLVEALTSANLSENPPRRLDRRWPRDQLTAVLEWATNSPSRSWSFYPVINFTLIFMRKKMLKKGKISFRLSFHPLFLTFGALVPIIKGVDLATEGPFNRIE